MLFIVINILYDESNNSISLDGTLKLYDIKQNIELYEYYVKTFSYCLENNYVFDIIYTKTIINIRCYPSKKSCCDYNIHLFDFDPYIVEMCIQIANSYALAISPLKTLFDQEINEIWTYSHDNHSEFIIYIALDYYIRRLDYYKKLLKIRSKYGML